MACHPGFVGGKGEGGCIQKHCTVVVVVVVDTEVDVGMEAVPSMALLVTISSGEWIMMGRCTVAVGGAGIDCDNVVGADTEGAAGV